MRVMLRKSPEKHGGALEDRGSERTRRIIEGDMEGVKIDDFHVEAALAVRVGGKWRKKRHRTKLSFPIPIPGLQF